MKPRLLISAAVFSLACAIAPAMSAQAAPPPGPAPSPSSQHSVLLEWTSTGLGSGQAIGDPSTSAASPKATGNGAALVTKGYDYKYYRGSVFVWTQDELQWYYTPTAIVSASGSQTCGFIFPDTCKNNGITRTLNTSAQQNWSGKNTVGIGSVTPWGTVNIASTTKVDKYQIYPNTNIKVIPG